jgi:O-antigen ligase
MKMTTATLLREDKTNNFATPLMFLLPALALTTSFGMSLVQLIILFASMWLAKKSMLSAFADNFRTLGPIIVGFAGYFIVSLARLLYFHQGLHTLDGPSRLLFGLSCIGFVLCMRPRIRWFFIGLCVGAIGAGVFALVQRFAFGMERVEGYTHHPISFGDLALALGCMSLCTMSAFRHTRLAWLPVAALLGGMLASALSGSRGGWIAVLLIAAPLLKYGYRIHGRPIVVLFALSLVLCVAAYFIPATGIAGRIAEAVSDVRLYINQNDATTSVGIRLELWKASWLMFAEHPLLGVGREGFFDALQVLAQQGRLQQSPALMYSSSHNDLLHFLATGGLLDGGFLLLMYLAPLRFFLSVLKDPHGGHETAALTGMTLVLCFIGFSLTDVMFWLMIPKVFYVMMVCTLVGFCLTTRELHD